MASSVAAVENSVKDLEKVFKTPLKEE